jgi:hypothetical protein
MSEGICGSCIIDPLSNILKRIKLGKSMYKIKPCLATGWFVQMRVNQSPLLQAAIRIGAAFVVANFGI